jgi:hypothetical protein
MRLNLRFLGIEKCRKPRPNACLNSLWCSQARRAQMLALEHWGKLHESTYAAVEYVFRRPQQDFSLSTDQAATQPSAVLS